MVTHKVFANRSDKIVGQLTQLAFCIVRIPRVNKLFGKLKKFSRENTTALKNTQLARKFKKVQAKKLVKSIFLSNCIFGSFELFPSSKIDFWPFLKLQKMEIDLFDFTSFLAWTFLNFLASCV